MGDAKQYHWARWPQMWSRPTDDSPAYTVSRVLFVAADRKAEPLASSLAQRVEVDWVFDIEAAREACESDRFDVVVIDVPEATEAAGRAAAQAIAELCRHVPGVPVLALAPSRDRGIEAVHQGAHGFAVKERFDAETLLDAASTAVALHRARCQIDTANERLVHADRLVSLGQLTAGVVHELNNPAALLLANLTAMKNQLARALRRDDTTELSATLREWADIVDESIAGIGHIRSIMRDVRNFSRIEEDEPGIVDVGEVIDTACKLTEGLIRRRARLVVDTGPMPTVKGDHSKLVQVFTNLLTNAAQAIDGPRHDNHVRVVTHERDGMVFVAVEDTGCGVPEDLRKLVFEPFFTTKPRDVGTGLGLALSVEIVRSYGGDISITALPGGGTRFEVRLIADGRAAEAMVEAGPEPDEEARAPRARLLLIDDEPRLLRAFRRILAPRHEVVMAGNGQQALDILERDTGFDGVICDFAMPDVDGIHIYEVVSRRDRELAARIVFCTGGPMNHRGRRFIETTSNTVLEKPVPPELLLGAIAELGKR